MELALKLLGILFGVLARTVEGLVKLFSTAFGFGFAWNSLVNETAKWTGQKAVVWPPLSQRAMVRLPIAAAIAKATEKKGRIQ